jgi:hypothetical protein
MQWNQPARPLHQHCQLDVSWVQWNQPACPLHHYCQLLPLPHMHSPPWPPLQAQRRAPVSHPTAMLLALLVPHNLHRAVPVQLGAPSTCPTTATLLTRLVPHSLRRVLPEQLNRSGQQAHRTVRWYLQQLLLPMLPLRWRRLGLPWGSQEPTARPASCLQAEALAAPCLPLARLPV